MSFRSIIQDLRDELGSISRKGFELKMGHGLRSRSHRVVHDALGPPLVGALRQSCWANMPPELLRDVLVRIEEGEGSWPVRKDVVACAGVCRSWRDTMKEIVMTPELSGKLTYPISLKQVWPLVVFSNQPLLFIFLFCLANHSFGVYLLKNLNLFLIVNQCKLLRIWPF